jgi:hypothetical protein
MINVATIGYRKYPISQGDDIIVSLIPTVLSLFDGLRLCHIDIIEDRNGESMDALVDRMIRSGTNVAHYVNFRDPYHTDNVDQQYLQLVRAKKPNIPVLLTSAHPDAKSFAKELGISYLNVPFNIYQYENALMSLGRIE